MPRFVVLRHSMPAGSARPSHWDLMLEQDGVLRTWALAAPPSHGCRLPAEALPDHRLAYLHYQGEVSGGRGRVRRWDEGAYHTLEENADRWRVHLAGRRLRGELVVCRADGDWMVAFAAAP